MALMEAEDKDDLDSIRKWQNELDEIIASHMTPLADKDAANRRYNDLSFTNESYAHQIMRRYLKRLERKRRYFK